jgi:AcrR family transcriptional regulator
MADTTATATTTVSAPPAPLPVREAQKRYTRTRLLDAAADLFSTRGYGSTSIEAIAAAAGASRATVYLHFASKSELALALREALDGFDTDHAQLRDVACRPSEVVVSRWLGGFLEHVTVRTHYATALRSARYEDPKVRATLDADFATSTDALARELSQSRGWDPEHTRVIATLLLRQLDIATDAWVRTDWDVHRTTVQHALTTTWIALLQHP